MLQVNRTINERQKKAQDAEEMLKRVEGLGEVVGEGREGGEGAWRHKNLWLIHHGLWKRGKGKERGGKGFELFPKD